MKKQIILGLGNNIDYEIVWDSKVFEKLINKYNIKNNELSIDIAINNERDLVVSIIAFLKSETGGERFVASSDIVEVFAQKFKYNITVGGTSIRAAIAMAKLGYTSTLHMVTINDHVRRLVPKGCTYVCSSKKDSIYPHLIVQFGQNVTIKASDINICTKRSNRIIYDNDYDNIMMELDDGLAELSSNAKVFLISGFNAMQDKNILVNRLDVLSGIIKRLPTDVCIFFEDACYHTPSFNEQVRNALINNIDIYSLNEDELQAYLGKSLDLLDAKQIKQALEELYLIIPSPLIVVHTSRWVLAYGDNACLFETNIKSGITMAGVRFIFGDNFTLADYEMVKNYAVQKQGDEFAIAISGLLDNKVCCLPCIDADEVNATTIGLGDAFVGGFLLELVKGGHS